MLKAAVIRENGYANNEHRIKGSTVDLGKRTTQSRPKWLPSWSNMRWPWISNTRMPITAAGGVAISPLGAYACNGHAEHGASKVHTVIARSRCLTRFFGRAPWVSAALSSAIAARSALLAHSDSERFCFIALRSVALRLEPAGQNAAAFTWLPGYKEKRENGLTRRNVICA